MSTTVIFALAVSQVNNPGSDPSGAGINSYFLENLFSVNSSLATSALTQLSTSVASSGTYNFPASDNGCALYSNTPLTIVTSIAGVSVTFPLSGTGLFVINSPIGNIQVSNLTANAATVLYVGG